MPPKSGRGRGRPSTKSGSDRAKNTTVQFTDLLASAASDVAGTTTTTNALGVGDKQTALATLVAALVNPGASNPLIVAIVRWSAVTAELAAAKTDTVAKMVKTKPTEQRDVSDVESSEETGDYTSTEPKKTLHRAIHLRKGKDRMKEQFAVLRAFYDQLAPLEETSGTVSDDDGMGPGLYHQIRAANRRFQKDTPDTRERDPSTESNTSRSLKSSRIAAVKTVPHADELGGEDSEDDKQNLGEQHKDECTEHLSGSPVSTNKPTGTNSNNAYDSLDKHATTH